MAERLQLHYASTQQAATDVRRRLLRLVACFGISWVCWFVLAWVNYDPFDDLAPWLLFFTAIPGTFCGLVFYLVVALVRYLWSVVPMWRRGSAS